MFIKIGNPMRKFGMRKRDLGKNYIFREIQFGETSEMLREMKRLNRKTRKLNDRKYFVWPVGGLLDQSVLVVGRKV